MPKLYLTNTFIENAKCPDHKDQELYWDHPRNLEGQIRRGAVKGLGLRVTYQGNKSFVHSYVFANRRKRVSIGTSANLNIASARLIVGQRELQLAAGENPDLNQSAHAQASLTTVREVIERYWETHITKKTKNYQDGYVSMVGYWLRSKPENSNNRGKHNQRKYQDFGAMFGERDLTSIKPLDMEAFFNQFPTAANHNKAMDYLKALFNWAIRMQIVDMRNPCDPLSKRSVVRKRRDYSPEQIKTLAKHIFNPVLEPVPAIVGEGADKRLSAMKQARIMTSNQQMLEFCNFLGILFLTMARPKELKEANFDHFDLDRLIWHKHNTKGIKLSKAIYEYEFRSVPIHKMVAEIVRRQCERWPSAVKVFPSQTDLTQPRDNFRRQFMRFKQLEGVPDYFQMYDLKRIGISLMLVGQGVRREDVSHYVDHKGDLETTMIYDLGFVDPLRPVTDRLGELLGL